MAVALEDLAPAATSHVSGQKEFGDLSFPLVLTPPKSENGATSFPYKQSVEAWIKVNQDTLKQAALQHGAVLFRGFPIETARDFDIVSKAAGLEEFPYVGGAAPRTFITGSVFTANESPADQLIPYHHELAQSKIHPGTLFFFCLKPAAKGGQTPICPSNLVYERINAEFPDFIAELGLRASNKAEAEKTGRELSMELEWLVDGSLKSISPTLPAFKPDPRTGKMSWFNSIVAAFTGWKDSRNDPTKAVVFGDSTPMNADILTRCLQIMDELSVSFLWEKGDVLIVDNWVTLHSRNPFEGQRVVYASLWK